MLMPARSFSSYSCVIAEDIPCGVGEATTHEYEEKSLRTHGDKRILQSTRLCKYS